MLYEEIIHYFESICLANRVEDSLRGCKNLQTNKSSQVRKVTVKDSECGKCFLHDCVDETVAIEGIVTAQCNYRR